MAQYGYEEWKTRSKGGASGRDFKVGYFNSLRDDGDFAIVRFAYESSKEFIVQDVHVVKVGEKYKRVVCPRDKYDSKDKCPLCAAGEYARSKGFVKVIEYVKDEDGKIVAQPKIWERPAKFYTDILTAFTNAKDLGLYPMDATIGDVVFKVSRDGAKGSKDTTYNVNPTNPAIYKPEIYVKDFSDFDGLDLAHHSYPVKTPEEIQHYLDTGDFPAPAKKDGQADMTEPEKPAAADVSFPSASTRTGGGASRYSL